ncbi:MAG TPA: SIR2 family protein [Pseudoduganella sp.]
MIPHELTRKFASGKGAVFVGAGMSMGADLPSWNELVTPLQDKLTHLKAGDQYSPEQIAGWYEVHESRETMIDFLKKQLSRDCVPTECHRLLARLPVDLFFTTNFDNLLELSLPDAEVVYNDVDFSMLDAPRKRQLIKVHGDFRDSKSIVFTRSDYDHYLEDRPTISELIRLTLVQRAVLFLGYSFNDRNLTTILAQVGRRLGQLRRPLFALLINPHPYVKLELDQKYGVTVIELVVPGEGRQLREGSVLAVRSWLERFRTQIERERNNFGDTQSMLPGSNLPLPSAGFVGRERDIDKVMKALQVSNVVAVSGPAGMGKTELVIEVARRCEFGTKSDLRSQPTLFAYCVYIDARDCNNSPSVLHCILDTIAEAFKLGAVKHAGLDQKKEQIRGMLAIFRVLLVIDNLQRAAETGIAQWLQEIPTPSAVILVTRGQFSGVSVRIPIAGFDQDDARAFLGEHLARRGIAHDDDHLDRLIATVHGSPQGMKMLVGQLATSGFPVSAAQPRDSMAEACDRVLADSWRHLGEAGKTVLRAASILTKNHIAREALVAASGLEEDIFSTALHECESLLLLEPCTEPWSGTGRVHGYKLHPGTASLVHGMFDEQPGLKDGFLARLAAYHRTFVGKVVVRPDPPVPYWNAVVTQDMLEIDDEWPSIRNVLVWAVEHEPEHVIALVNLLVHYMDSRLLNSDRIRFSYAAAAALGQQGRVQEEALLRIDALGWTLVEEGQFDEAEQEIAQGLALVEACDRAQAAGLESLALAWRARAQCLQDRAGKAQQEITRALRASRHEENWIRYRVHMVAGDIRVKQGNIAGAIRSYEKCRRLVNSYGGEEGYQTLPRLGMAHLRNGQLNQAEKVFSELLRVCLADSIAIGALYARYGLAYIASRDTMRYCSARLQLKQIRAQLSRATTSNLLHRLMDELEKSLDAAEGRA